MSTKRIIVWTAPRCVSTAFERSLMNLDNSKTLHEPFSQPYYFGEERKSARYVSDPPRPGTTYHSVAMMLQKDYDGIDLVISKDMAYYVEDCNDILLDEGLADIQHTFLVRNPKKAINSLYKASTNPKLTGWSYFDPKEAGFVQLFSLYNFVRQNLDPSPVIIDADELLEFPEETMKSFCGSVGVEYKPGMTEWEPGPVDGFEVWAGWHEDVLKSTGFVRKNTTNKTTQKKAEQSRDQELPTVVTMTIEESLPVYEIMYKNRTKPLKGTLTDI